MEWGEDLQHGLIWQDFQHKQLVDHINMLLDAVVTGNKDKEIFYKTVKFIKDYSQEHFGLEELYMARHAFPGMEGHIKAHKIFVKNFDQFVSASIYRQTESSTDLLNKLSAWFFNHIHTTDKVLAEFLIKAGVE